MKKYFLVFVLALAYSSYVHAQEWTPVGDRIKTVWANEVSPENVWQQYPRPQMIRKNWKNLNGLWSYAIRPKGEKEPNSFDGKILVPFCVESSLSGVGKSLSSDEELWYRTEFDVTAWKGKDITIHFGAVDFKSTLYINGKKVGVHEGGNDPFSYNITKYLKGNGKQKLVLSVWDPTDQGIQPRGKQILNPKGFWYTAVSGIWQTVWLEPLEKTHIKSLNPIANVDDESVSIKTELAKAKGNEKISLTVFHEGKKILEETYSADENLNLSIPNANLWSPEFPHLYDLKVVLTRNGKVLDQLDSYFAMRKIALGKDDFNRTKLFLNNEELFQFGTLDQGWWPDGLLTPPTEEAMVYDMKVVKDLGFNMIRKHIKVEPALYYYHADKLGILLWQDMPSGFLDINHPEQHVKHDSEKDWDRPSESAEQFKAEWKSIIDNLSFFPSIVVWVPFNEGWGQFQSKEITNWTMAYDPSRLVNGTSGWADRGVGHFYDAHQYPGPAMEPPSQNPGRAVVLGEFGGLGHPIKGHIWDANRNNWGYRTYVEKDAFLNQYAQAISNLYPERARGLAAAIYTQTTDVEAEVNGLLTYDRKILKLPIDVAKLVHMPLYENVEKQAEFLIEDGELEEKTKNISIKTPEENWTVDFMGTNGFENMVTPSQTDKGSAIFSRDRFNLDEVPENVALKFYGDGDVTVYFNGVAIFSKYLRTKRHYDDINLSVASKFLKKGKNTFAIEVKNIKSDTYFDYGLYKF